jgi:hypothetical protein
MIPVRIIPEDYQTFTSFGSPIDLYTTTVRHARVIKIQAGSGTISVKMAGSAGATRVLTVAAGEEVWGLFGSIESVTGVTSLRAGW